MKKNLLLLAITMLVTLLGTSCKPTLPTLPQNIQGFWRCQPNQNAIWYGLDVTDNVSATLSTYQETEELETIEMAITYDAISGKGQLLGDGILLQLQAMSENIIHIRMVEGDIAFTK